MAIVNKMKKITLDSGAPHSELKDCTYSIVVERARTQAIADRFVRLSTRKNSGKKSQSLRFSREAVEQLRRILSEEL